ncbi:hypothetical protein LMXM_15_1343 [Leishmania mexicana MHOM/GT/2001/U1103]|uniref:FCP1 homology domain-containing protein n=1 Tax=Leishmania mexicana (strain MHOM/GT/2001/U1103) TaxID=929439 RepID=E9AQC7_LEIMU|nr:hypothetical protein LMXM_15_1343 [Leishmania mexicana MHOM/GT/2001/U1103]CBZ25146.1 hypothetical protein LMXM_15_1343 [Leishmania mexicana MHOM/GT/2001/U1103]
MHRPAARLPVHFLVDIDHTLVHPVYRRVAGNNSDTTRCRSGPLPPASAWGWWLLNYVDGRVTHVRLRPHVVPFLSHVLLDRSLDTSETEVHVSLYTRQSAAYCAAIAHQVLLPALAQSKGKPLHEFRRNDVFHRLFGGERCVRGKFEATYWLNPSPGLLSEGSPADQRQLGEATASLEWRKTIFVLPSPLTTLLVDDRCVNFRVTELRTGHGVLVPSYYADAVACAADDCFRVPPTDSLYDVIGMDLDGRGGGVPSGRAMLGRVDVNDVVVGLLDVLEAFVQCCHSHRCAIEAMHGGSAGMSSPGERTSCAARPPVDAALSNFNFFERSPLYRQQWNAFHAHRADLLHSYFTG